MPDENDNQQETTQHALGASEVEVKDWGESQSFTGSMDVLPEYRWRGNAR
jgi:hypothetical protein